MPRNPPLSYLAAMWLAYIVFILLIAYCTLIVWYRRAWLDMPEQTNANSTQFIPSTFVTLIIPARNEANNISNCLNGIIAQRYPKKLLQVLVMDDASEDDTAGIAHSFTKVHPYIEVLQMSHETGGRAHKKRAIENAIRQAKGTLIVATDADCTHSPGWLENMVLAYESEQKKFVAAPVMLDTEASILSIFQTLDFMSLQGITGASVSRRFHTMCNGANIAYSKDAFHKVNGFEGIDDLPTGDDMLLMYKIFNLYPNGITWLKNKETIVNTQAAASWRAFFQQRIRWASKAAYYDDKRIFYVLLLVYLFNAGMLALGICSFFSPECFKAFIISLVIKTTVELYFLIPVGNFFEKEKWLWYFPLMQPLHIIYTVIAGWLGRFGSYEWKGRTIKKQ